MVGPPEVNHEATAPPQHRIPRQPGDLHRELESLHTRIDQVRKKAEDLREYSKYLRQRTVAIRAHAKEAIQAKPPPR